MNDGTPQQPEALDALLAGYSQDIQSLKEDVARLYGHVETLQEHMAALVEPVETGEGEDDEA